MHAQRVAVRFDPVEHDRPTEHHAQWREITLRQHVRTQAAVKPAVAVLEGKRTQGRKPMFSLENGSD